MAQMNSLYISILERIEGAPHGIVWSAIDFSSILRHERM